MNTGTTNNPSGIYLAQTTAVGSYAANPWGLYDMMGNAFEACQDWYGEYPTGSVTDPQGPATGKDGLIRGGDMGYPALFCRSAFRPAFAHGDREYDIGFRVLLAPGQP